MRDFWGRLHRLRLLITGVGVVVAIAGLSVADASSANISKSYAGDAATPNGSLVSLDRQQSDYVVLASTDNGSRLIGVAVAPEDSLLAVDPTTGKIQVATSGNANVLASTINGNINVGDAVAVSPFEGIGMRSVSGAKVIGLAQSTLSTQTEGVTQRTVTDRNGKESSIYVGFVKVSLVVGNDNSSSGGSQLNGLQKAAESVIGRVVPTSRIVLSLLIAVVALLALITLIYAAIYGSILSIGRNPLAKYAIFRTLGSVLGLAALMAVVAGVTIFLLLK